MCIGGVYLTGKYGNSLVTFLVCKRIREQAIVPIQAVVGTSLTLKGSASTPVLLQQNAVTSSMPTILHTGAHCYTQFNHITSILGTLYLHRSCSKVSANQRFRELHLELPIPGYHTGIQAVRLVSSSIVRTSTATRDPTYLLQQSQTSLETLSMHYTMW